MAFVLVFASGGAAARKDRAPPVIGPSFVQPQVAGPGTLVWFNVSASDDVQVASVVASMAGPLPSNVFIGSANLFLARGTAQSGTWIGNWPVPNTLATGNYSVAFTATDGAGFSTSASGGIFYADLTPPSILNFTSPSAIGFAGEVAVTAVLADDIGVAGATMIVLGPLASPTFSLSAGLSLVSGTAREGVWQGALFFPWWPVPPAGTYAVYLSAFDVDGNYAPVINRTFIFDPYPPTLVAWSVFPSAVGLGGRLNLTMTAADDEGVASVSVFLAQAFAGSNATIGPVSLSLAVGTPLSGIWTGVLTLSPPSSTEDGIYSVAVDLYDVGGNEILYTPTQVLVDQTPPDTTILSAVDGRGKAIVPGSFSRSSTATFTFAGTDNFLVQAFVCSLDGAEWTVCSSPWTLTNLARGAHVFQIAAIDEAGNVDPTPATFSWTVRA